MGSVFKRLEGAAQGVADGPIGAAGAYPEAPPRPPVSSDTS